MDEAYSSPGTIQARNKETGVIYLIRPHMLQLQDNPWEVITQTVTTDKVIKAEEIEEVTEHLTAKGLPFKSEAAARTAMKKKGLSEMNWAILPVADGFIIKKV